MITELLVDAVLLPFAEIDMTRPYLPLLGATDASTVYGLGATVAEATQDQFRRISRLSAKCGEHATVMDGP